MSDARKRTRFITTPWAESYFLWVAAVKSRRSGQVEESKFLPLLNKLRVVPHSRVAKVSEPVGRFVGFFKDDAQLGLEFVVRPPAAGGSIVRTHAVGGPAELICRLLCFLRFG
jgi:hypothetical protein